MVEAERFENFKFKINGEYYPISKKISLMGLPDGESIEIDRYNMSNYARNFFIPFCAFASVIEDKNYKKVDNNSKVCFFDVETTDDEKFKYALVKDKNSKDIRKFENARELLKELSKYDFAVGHNIVRYDFKVLYDECPEYFKVNQLSSFIEYIPLNFLPLDTYVMARMNASLGEGGYSLYNLAKNCGYEKERLDIEDENRCQQDVEMLGLVYDGLNIEEGYNFLTDYSKCDAIVIMNSYSIRLVKQILLTRYLINGYLPFAPPEYKFKDPIPALHYAKRGMFYNQVYKDIGSTYPISAIKLNKTLYNFEYFENKESDYKKELVFPKTMRELVEYAKNPKLKGYAKFLANVMIGSMRDQKNNFKNEELWMEILNLAHNEVLKIFNSVKKDCIYANTDCFIVPEGKELKHEFYELKDKYGFEWIVIYDSNKILGKTKEGEIVKRHFNKYFKCDLIRKADEEIEKLLVKIEPDKIIDLLNNPIELTKDALKLLNKKNEKLMKIKIRKTSSICDGANAEFSFIWEKLKYGFNDLYLTEEGYSKEPKELDLNKYREEIMTNAKQYAIKINEDKNGSKDN